MLTRGDEDQLVNGLRDLIRNENDIEAQKTQLAMKSDFNLGDAFKMFDTNHNGAITVHELRSGLNSVGLFPTHEETDLFMTRYDKSGDRRLN